MEKKGGRGRGERGRGEEGLATFRIETFMHVGVLGLKPVFAFFGCAAKLTVLAGHVHQHCGS